MTQSYRQCVQGANGLVLYLDLCPFPKLSLRKCSRIVQSEPSLQSLLGGVSILLTQESQDLPVPFTQAFFLPWLTVVLPSACSALLISALHTSLRRPPCNGWHSCYFSRQWGLEGGESERQELGDRMTSEGRPDQTKLDRCHHGKYKGKNKHLVLVQLTQHLRRAGLWKILWENPLI